jgi:hypothetical protein
MTGPNREKCNATNGDFACSRAPGGDHTHRHLSGDGNLRVEAIWDDAAPGAKPHDEPTKREAIMPQGVHVRPTPKQDAPPSAKAMQAAVGWLAQVNDDTTPARWFAHALDAFAADAVTAEREAIITLIDRDDPQPRRQMSGDYTYAKLREVSYQLGRVESERDAALERVKELETWRLTFECEKFSHECTKQYVRDYEARIATLEAALLEIAKPACGSKIDGEGECEHLGDAQRIARTALDAKGTTT